MHLADAFIQSDLQYIQAIHYFISMCSLGIEPTTFALLTQCSTTEPQEHLNQMNAIKWIKWFNSHNIHQGLIKHCYISEWTKTEYQV